MKNTSTPRTDEILMQCPAHLQEVALANLSQDLERELAASKAEIKDLKESAERIGTNRYEQLKKAEAEVEELRKEMLQLRHASLCRYE